MVKPLGWKPPEVPPPLAYSQRLNLAKNALRWLESHEGLNPAMPTEAEAVNVVTALDVLGLIVRER
jgi:hypothetical protein